MENEFRKIQLRTILLFSALILGITIYLTLFLAGQSNYILRKNASGLIAASNRQLELNIDGYLSRIQRTASLLYSEKSYFSYDPTDENADEYTQIQTADEINEKIQDLGVTENYSDFGIVYSNDDSVGWISQITQAMYVSGGMYDDFDRLLNEGNGESRWVFGLNNNTDHIYYLKRFNDKGIIVISIFSRELQSDFEIPEQLDGMTVYLVDLQNTILYSNKDYYIGSRLDSTTSDLITDLKNGSVLTEDLLVTVDSCSNGWRIVCSLPSEIVVKGNRQNMWITLLMAAVMSFLILSFGILLTKRMNVSANQIVDSLQLEASHDRMTGLLNKTEFQESVSSRIAAPPSGSHMCLTVFDLDNFKQMNDQYGHLNGDNVLRSFSGLLTETFASEFFTIGRIGGDEFAVFGILDTNDAASVRVEMEQYMAELRSRFMEMFKEYSSRNGLSFSSGTVMIRADEKDYAEIFNRADRLLYESKKSGKGKDVNDYS